MPLLDSSSIKNIQSIFSNFKDEIEILFFEDEGLYTHEIKQLLTELSVLSSKIKLSLHKVGDEKAQSYGIERGPVIKLLSKHMKGDFRYYGIPSGYEFNMFLHILEVLSTGKITGPLVESSKKINEEMKLEIFLSPTCPHCPSSAIVGFKLAMLNEKVKAHVYEVMEFESVAQRNNVRGVPKTVINEGKHEYVGGLPEDFASREILKAI